MAGVSPKGIKILAMVAGGVAILGIAAGYTYYSKRSKEHAATPPPATVSAPVAPGETPAAPGPQPEEATPPPGATLTVAELTTADWPPSITLLKPQPLRFKKGTTFIAKAGTPLFFLNEYQRDAKTGEQFQILDYNPETRRVFLRSTDSTGNTVALNTLDLHDAGTECDTLPASTVVTLQGISDGNALVTYNGDKFAVPVYDTDLLQQASSRRAQREGSGGN